MSEHSTISRKRLKRVIVPADVPDASSAPADWLAKLLGEPAPIAPITPRPEGTPSASSLPAEYLAGTHEEADPQKSIDAIKRADRRATMRAQMLARARAEARADAVARARGETVASASSRKSAPTVPADALPAPIASSAPRPEDTPSREASAATAPPPQAKGPTEAPPAAAAGAPGIAPCEPRYELDPEEPFRQERARRAMAVAGFKEMLAECRKREDHARWRVTLFGSAADLDAFGHAAEEVDRAISLLEAAEGAQLTQDIMLSGSTYPGTDLQTLWRAAMLGVPRNLRWERLALAAMRASDMNAETPAFGGYQNAPPLDASQPGAHPWIAELNRRHFVGRQGGKTLVFEERVDSDRRVKLEAQTRGEFAAWLANQDVPQGSVRRDIDGGRGVWWLHHPQRRQYDEVAFRPGVAPRPGLYNLWRGWPYEPVKGDCSLYRQFVQEIICDGNGELFEYLWRWMARIVQRPNEPTVTVIGLRSTEEGVGKSFFDQQFGALFGPYFMEVSDDQHIVGRFNAHLEQTILLAGDEAVFARDHKAQDKLRSLVSAPTITIEKKFQDVRTVQNYLHVILNSNKEHFLGLGGTGEARRYVVSKVSAKHVEDHPYFAAIAAQMQAGGYSALMYELLHLDLAGFNHRERPITTALRQQQDLSLALDVQWWRDVLMAGVPPCRYSTASGAPENDPFDDKAATATDPWAAPITLDAGTLYLAYVKALKEEHGSGFVEIDDRPLFAKRLRDMLGGNCKVTRPRSQGVRPRCYTIPSLADCRAAYERFRKLKPGEQDWQDADAEEIAP